jgi:hypothetical protein
MKKTVERMNAQMKRQGDKIRKTNTKKNWVIVGNGDWGLYFGHIKCTDAQVLQSKAVRLYECRHVAEWYGKTGGITSLAAFGPCGVTMGSSLIGSPCPSSLICDVRAIHSCTDEAVDAFGAIVAK